MYLEELSRVGLRALALVTDAFGGSGGIARYNRDFLTALADTDSVSEVVVLPRLRSPSCESLPYKIRQLPAAVTKTAYATSALLSIIRNGPFDLVFCGHLFMSPLAILLARLVRAPLWIQVHGFEAWAQPSLSMRLSTERADLVTSVSRYTRHRLLSWSDIVPSRVRVLPNTVSDRYKPGAKPEYLSERYGLTSKKVLLTVSRLVATEGYKGHDRVIVALPGVLLRQPNTVYVVAGDGDDRPRLERLAVEKGVSQSIRFVGSVSDIELIDYYHMADVFVMPSTGEGFGIVFLEAAASGLPVIGGNRDGSFDALAEGAIGVAIDPNDPKKLISAICAALDGSGNTTALRIDRFSKENFTTHVAELTRNIT
ncbi:glycosyltransferase family 4 protein [bacterium]|nr:glycosyltransferase family 4 protein [bacterium]